jgi:hypothetical protein
MTAPTFELNTGMVSESEKTVLDDIPLNHALFANGKRDASSDDEPAYTVRPAGAAHSGDNR